MSDRDRRLAELMGIPIKKGGTIILKTEDTIEEDLHEYVPDFSLPEWRAKLMDWAVEQEWWNGFVEKQKSIFLGKWVRGEIDGKPWVNPESEFITYLWRNLPDLAYEYDKEREK